MATEVKVDSRSTGVGGKQASPSPLLLSSIIILGWAVLISSSCSSLSRKWTATSSFESVPCKPARWETGRVGKTFEAKMARAKSRIGLNWYHVAGYKPTFLPEYVGIFGTSRLKIPRLILEQIISNPGICKKIESAITKWKLLLAQKTPTKHLENSDFAPR